MATFTRILSAMILSAYIIGDDVVIGQSRSPPKRLDVCTKNTCYHNGVCVQTTIEPGYKCRCSGTGYYGERCQNACPTPGIPVRKTTGFPFECVVI